MVTAPVPAAKGNMNKESGEGREGRGGLTFPSLFSLLSL
jgi:hypothetical protein